MHAYVQREQAAVIAYRRTYSLPITYLLRETTGSKFGGLLRARFCGIQNRPYLIVNARLIVPTISTRFLAVAAGLPQSRLVFQEAPLEKTTLIGLPVLSSCSARLAR